MISEVPFFTTGGACMNHRISIRILPVLAFVVFILATCTRSGGGTPTAVPVPPANTDGAATVFVPGGAYLMGSTETDVAALPHEMPQHEVTLTGFNIYTHEVTNLMYQACAAAGACLPVTALRDDLAGYYDNAAYADFPIVGVG
jgi:formylglycine-generating enzyme required for sulfatase activity